MARRHRYGYNGQWNNFSTIGQITPIGYMETVPGETWSGSANMLFWSDTTKQPWTNKMFADVFAFYVPFRLLFNRFPDLVRGDVSQDEGPVPDVPEQAAGSVAWNYIQQGRPRPNVFQMRAFNLVVEKFFDYENFANSSSQPEMGTSNNGVYDNTDSKFAAYRSSVFDTSMKGEAEVHDSVAVDTTGDSFTTADLRSALMQDNFNKLRDYYGSRYVDYLSALGVKGQWTMMDEPELLGQVHHTLPLEITSSTVEGDGTPDTFIGTPRGQWKAPVKMTLKKTFTPEHGLIMFVAVNRLQAPLRDVRPVVGYNFNREQFWSPEYQTGRERNYNQGQFGTGAVDYWAPEWEHLRKGENIVADRQTTTGYHFQRGLLGQIPEVNNSANSRLWANVDDIFDGTFPDVPGESDVTAHFQITADYRLVKYSPIVPNNFRQPLR